ncbi:MAG TPA: winged helix DNA-binding domain-containing protein [Candidatus Angelobacter sp.]|nr:winged helix DNA-binding domain-containing protein [Candidatus Angelobacter sp.]
MKKPSKIFPAQIAAFRLRRHHLLARREANLVAVCADVCGVQAQVMTSAQLALWARVPNVTRAAIQTALWEKRALIKTSCMRQTLHLLAAADFSTFITAERDSRMAGILRIMARFGIPTRDVEPMNRAVMDALADGPLTLQQLAAEIKPKLNKKLRTWMEAMSNGFRPAIAEGLICYAPSRGAEATLVRVDQWLPRQKKVSVDKAQTTLFHRYLHAYGPATLQDFSRWSGIPMSRVKQLRELLQDVVEFDIEQSQFLLLAKDYGDLKNSGLEGLNVRLLPGFDPYLLGHALKGHLVEPCDYKQVYRNQWWISAVILVNGRVQGTWTHGKRRGRTAVDIHPFKKLSAKVRDKIESEAASLAKFMDAS